MERTRQGRWTRQDSAAYCLVDRWGVPHVHVDARGNLALTPRTTASPPVTGPAASADAGARKRAGASHPGPGGAPEVDLRELVEVLRARGAGRWSASSGDRSKFGPCAGELREDVHRLRAAGTRDCLQPRHFPIGPPIGPQLTDINSVRGALREAGRTCVGLRALGVHALRTIDCGGGLAVDGGDQQAHDDAVGRKEELEGAFELGTVGHQQLEPFIHRYEEGLRGTTYLEDF